MQYPGELNGNRGPGFAAGQPGYWNGVTDAAQATPDPESE